MNILADKKPTQQSGMTLVELLVVMVLSVAIIGTIIQVFVTSRKTQMTQSNVNFLQENARHALHTLGHDIRMAGYLGDVQQYWSVTERNPGLANNIANECFTQDSNGNRFRWVAPFLASDPPRPNQNAPAPAGANFGPKLFGENNQNTQFTTCTNNYRPNTDVISVHYVGPNSVPDAARAANTYYLNTNLFSGLVYQCTGNNCGNPNLPATDQNYPLYAALYYVSDCATQNTAGCTPGLMRSRLDTDGTIISELVAEGVVDMQIQYGADTNGDGIPNTYFNTNIAFNDPAQWSTWASTKAARVWLLFRSPEPGFTDPNGAFSFADITHSPEDNFRYQLFTTTLAVRNPYSPQNLP